jgi:hypothetical protein
MPTLGSHLCFLEGSAASRKLVAGYTRPDPGGAPGAPERLMGVVALDNPLRLLDYAPLVGSLVTPDPALTRASGPAGGA